MLTWLPSTDPNNNFSYYEIFYATQQTGIYSSAGTVAPVSATSFTQSGSSTGIQSCYYYVVAVYGVGTSTVTRTSDTLKSIFLNIINTSGAPNIKLVYNDLNTPRLPSASGPNNVFKEYPIGSWNTLAVTNQLNYSDTISVCQASMNYQVTMHDDSGCISASNIMGGVYSDTKSPYQPFVDSISVLPNGNVILSWRIPKDEDLIDYVIYQAQTNSVTGTITYPPIDTVNGRPSSSYIFTNTVAAGESLALFVAGLDSCGNIGTYDNLPKTMALGVNYDSCKFESRLFWNEYKNMPNGGVTEYRIYYAVNGGSFTSVGTSTAPAFIHLGVNPGQNICYYVRAFNKNKSISSSSNRICFFSSQAKAPAFLYMRSATVLKENSVTISLFLDTLETCKAITIERSDDGLSFKQVGYLPIITGVPNYTFTDDSAKSSQYSYYYRALVIDNCGNQRTPSNISRTMLLKIEEDKELIFNKHLSWNSYAGFAGGVSGYNIYRVVNEAEPGEAITSLGLFATDYLDNMQDEAPKGSKVQYIVEAVEGIGNPYGFYETSRSNARDVYMEGRVFVPDAFVPAGVNKKWLPVTHFIDKSEYKVTVFNRWGNKLFETTDDTQGWDGGGAEYGIYVYLITYKNSRGEYEELKGTFLLMR